LIHPVQGAALSIQAQPGSEWGRWQQESDLHQGLAATAD
jgi:hypothetical protein